MRRFPGCTLALLAGGRGERLGGIDKSALRLPDGRTILERTLGELSAHVEAVLVVGGDPAGFPGLETIPDFFPGRGAPGGLHAACLAARTEWVLALAIDMPAVDLRVLDALWSRRLVHDAVAGESDRGPELLHAFWRAGPCAAAAEKLLGAGEPSMLRLARAVGVHVVPADELRAIDPELRSFANANTPEDAARLGLIRP